MSAALAPAPSTAAPATSTAIAPAQAIPAAVAPAQAIPAAPAPASVRAGAAGARASRRPIRLRPLRGLRTVTHERPAGEATELDAARLLTLVPPIPPAPDRPESRSEDDERWPDVTPLRSLTGPTADPARVCASIVQVCAEAMRGLRPLVQLTRWVDEAIFTELAAFAPTHGSRSSVQQRLEPDSTASVLAQARLRKVRVTRTSPQIADATVLVELDGRVRAVVVRLEARRGSWRATELRAL